MKVSVYDDARHESLFFRILSTLLCMRYTALVEIPGESVRVYAGGFTLRSAERRGVRRAKRAQLSRLVREYDC